MKRLLLILSLALLTAASFSSCKAVKKFLATDYAEDEDFIIGQLYADEYVEEEHFTPRRTNLSANKPQKPTGKCGVELNDMDNKALYGAIDAWYGTPYLYGGCSKEGVDCSCFVNHIYKEVYGLTLHRVAADIAKDVTLIDRKKLHEGDIVFFTNSNGKISHVGIYLKDDMFVHSSTSRGVTVSTLSNTYWNQHFYKGGRHSKVTTKYK